MALMLPDEKPSRLAYVLMFLANALACAQIYDLVPDDKLCRKLVLFATALLSTYGFRAALKLPPPSEK